ncbi:MAG: hypothetical protein CL916_05565 [Deltaproteobacteria bacterium]|nr:hypothetical protein [Deltaproteobacteria bacterium]
MIATIQNNLMSNFHTPSWLSNPHIQTVYPHLFRKVAAPLLFRERFETSDGDFFDVDMRIKEKSPIVVLLHGLEGSSMSTYIQGAAELFLQKGWGIAAINLRSCSGEINRRAQFYHSGWFEDLDRLVVSLRRHLVPIFGLGFSLGGNLMLKYSGSKTRSSFDAVMAVSAPIDLSSSTHSMRLWPARLYEKRFLRMLQRKMRKKTDTLLKEGIPVHKAQLAKTIREFDRYLTAHSYGFNDEEEYYQQASALPVLNRIRIPAHLLQSKDDPMLSSLCYPHQNSLPKNITCLYTQRGGHVGFVYGSRKERKYFAQEEAERFFDRCLELMNT